MISVENSTKQMLPKKKKRPPQRRCGDWCEFLSSKGKLYYFHIKKGFTQWTKPDVWDDNQVIFFYLKNNKFNQKQAYEPTAKRPKEDKIEKPIENVAPTSTTLLVTTSSSSSLLRRDKEEPWLSSMTSLKAKLQLKSDLKRSQKKRRDRVLDQLKHIEQEATQKVQVFL